MSNANNTKTHFKVSVEGQRDKIYPASKLEDIKTVAGHLRTAGLKVSIKWLPVPTDAENAAHDAEFKKEILASVANGDSGSFEIAQENGWL